MDVGICGDRRFLHMAGAGIDSRIFLATDAAKKRRMGWVAYLGPAARSLAAEPSRFTIEVDGATLTVTASLVLVANGTSILKPYFPTFRDIRPDDGQLDVLVVAATGVLPLAGTVARLVTRTLGGSPYVTRLRGRAVSLTADPPLPLELDGDVVGTTPASFSLAPGALRLIVPRF
jgi:diacylglycerol kinase family enzyme